MSFFTGSQPINKRDLMFSNGEILKIIIPLLIQQVLNMTVGMVDSMMVSYAGEAAVSGVSLVNTLDNMLIVFFTALVSGGSVIIANTLGTKDSGRVVDLAKQLLYAATSVAVVVATVVLLLKRPLLSLLFGDVETDVMQNALDYFSIVALSFPLLAINESTGACFRSEGNSLISLLVSLAINIMNVCGNAICIIGLGMGARGAALATVIARFGGSVILLIFIHNKKHPVHIERIFNYKPNFKVIKNILGIGIPNGIENAMFTFGRLLTQTLISMLGTTVIAANSVALSIANYQYAVTTAFGACAIPIIGRCMGAGKKDQAKYYSRILLVFEYVILAAVILLTLVFLKPLMSTYNISEEGIELAMKLIFFHSGVAAVMHPLGFFLPHVFHAVGDVRFKLVVSMLSMWCIRVALAYVLTLESIPVFGLFSIQGLGLGIWGVWIAMMGDWLLRAVLYTIRYFSGIWLKKKSVVSE